MPSDLTNWPFPRPTPRDPVALAALEGESVTQLRAENILLEEFAHASVEVYQTNEDRNSLLNHFLILAGVIATAAGVSVSAAFSANLVGPLLAVALGLVLAFLLSFGFFVRLIQLSRKRREALLTMTVIKEFYIAEFRERMPQLQTVLRWRLHTLPIRGRTSGTTFFIGSIIAMTGSFYLGAAAELLYHYTREFGGALQQFSLYMGSIPIRGIIVDAPVFLAALSLYIAYYRHARRKYNLSSEIQEQATKFGLTLPRT